MELNTKLYMITDSTDLSTNELCNKVGEATKAGVTIVQLREKNKSTREYIDMAKAVHEITKSHGVPLVIDDRVDVMLAVDAEGVHLGAEDMPVEMARKLVGPEKIIGATTKTVEAAKKAYEAGADYLGVGAIFPTTTKVKTIITSTDTLREICEEVPIPVNAIGGLTPKNMKVLSGIEIAGVCAVSGIMKAENITQRVEEYIAAIEKFKGENV